MLDTKTQAPPKGEQRVAALAFDKAGETQMLLPRDYHPLTLVTQHGKPVFHYLCSELSPENPGVPVIARLVQTGQVVDNMDDTDELAWLYVGSTTLFDTDLCVHLFLGEFTKVRFPYGVAETPVEVATEDGGRHATE